MSDHTTADDATRYRKAEEKEEWMPRDPMLRLERYMAKKGLWTPEYQKEVAAKAKEAVDEAEKQAEALAPPEPKDLFTFTYSSLTQRQLSEQEDFR
jgi:pyruvate dehydrogenase E1 component alpha subunit